MCTGRKWNTKVRCGWVACQACDVGWRLVGRGGCAYDNARLLIDTEQRAVGGRTEQQLDEGYGFGGEVGITIVQSGVKTVQANLVALEDDADGALARLAQADLGMSCHVLRQVFILGRFWHATTRS